MTHAEEQFFLQEKVFTKVQYDPLLERFIIHADDYIELNLTTRQLKLLVEMCKESDIVLERLPEQMEEKESRATIAKHHKLKKETAVTKDTKTLKKLNKELDELKERVVEGHLYFIHKLVLELYPSDLNPEEKDELYQELYLVLLESIEAYKYKQPKTFLEYLKEQILIHLSEIEASKQEMPVIESTDKHREDIEENENYQASPEYLEDTLDEELFKKIKKETIYQLLDFVTPIQKKVLILYLGLDGETPKKKVEIARMLGCSASRVRQIIFTALSRFKQYPYKNILLDLYGDERTPEQKKRDDASAEMAVDISVNKRHTILTTRIEQLEEQYFQNMPTHIILDIAEELLPIHKKIIILYYGIGVEAVKDKTSLSRILEISQQAVLSTKKEALKEFKATLAKKHPNASLSDKHHNEHMANHYLKTTKK